MLIASREEGPGPLHTLLATRKLANCYTPEETIERHGEGIIEVRVNLLCLDGEDSIAEPPCAARLEAEGIYRSEVAAATSPGAPCSGLISRVESLAQDETRFTANESVVFAKALTLQNGNQVTITPAYVLAMGQQVSRMGPSVSFQYRFGITQSVLNGTGSESGLLNAFGNVRPDLPATLTLESQGRTRVFGEKRATARALAHTRAAGLWMAGTTGCPGAGWFALQIIFGDPAELLDARQRAEQFFLTRLGRSTP
jgi:hypothetical protein